MKIKLTFVLTLATLLNVTGQNFKFPVIIDTVIIGRQSIQLNKKTSFQRIPFYIGAYKDTIIIGRFHHDCTLPIKNSFAPTNTETENKYPWLPDSSIEFFINQKQEVTFEEYENNSYINYKALTVIVRNKLDSTITVGYGYDIPIIIEALDKEKKWRPIETRHFYDCGVGLKYILLKPKNIACVLIPKYKGDFKTLIRLRLNKNYSAPFKAAINLGQFDAKTVVD